MKISMNPLFLLFWLLCVAIAEPIQSYILFYPYGTPDAIKAEAKATIIKSGGKILYEYKNFNGFAATIPKPAMESVRQLGNPQIMEDKPVHPDAKSGLE